MADIESVMNKIDEVLAELAAPLTDQEVSEGWSQESKQAMAMFFENVKEQLLCNQQLPPLFIPRGMDCWGVTKGKILESGASISLDLNRIFGHTKTKR